jgi:Zn-dependent oligopeptidase
MIDEYDLLKSNLPEGIILTEKGQFKPWDLKYVAAQYKHNHLALDENKIKEYFPMQKTMDELLDIYAQFLGVDFRQDTIEGLWHEDVLYIGVYTRDGNLLGHILLDLYPRPKKYSHGCMESIVPAVRGKDGAYCPPVIMIITNFNKPTSECPALFSQADVSTLFHEFGHAHSYSNFL